MHEPQKPALRGEQLLSALLEEQRRTNSYLRSLHHNVMVIGLMIAVPFLLLFTMLAILFFSGIAY